MSEPGPWLEMPTRHEEWLVLTSWRRLHRVVEVTPADLDDGLPNGHGKTLCGQEGHLMVPGLFSRMGLERCARCCDKLGIPRGNGNTLNGHIEEPPGTRWKYYDDLMAVWEEGRLRYEQRLLKHNAEGLRKDVSIHWRNRHKSEFARERIRYLVRLWREATKVPLE